ncbi:MAG: hypothetical protein RIQ33_2069, partial [Bacteroidota bacterium]
FQRNENQFYSFPKLKTFPSMPQSVLNPITIKGVELGRFLFYDSILSVDKKMSCGSCHHQEFAFSDSPNKFSKGKNGLLMKRNTMPLFNLAWYQKYFWDGRANSIEEQIYFPVKGHDEMDLNWRQAEKRINNNKFYVRKFKSVFNSERIDSVQITKAIAQFLRTLISYQSKYDLVFEQKAEFTKEEYYGFELMNDQTKGDCLHCHTTDGNSLGTIGTFSNNGLDNFLSAEQFIDKGLGGATNKKTDIGKFKIPSLRNVALTAPYMHDGRFETLEDVLNFYSNGVKSSLNVDSKMEFVHKGGARLTTTEKYAIIAFLKTLTDSVFISNKAYSNPFK